MDYRHRARAWTLVLVTDSQRGLRWRKATWKVRCQRGRVRGQRSGTALWPAVWPTLGVRQAMTRPTAPPQQVKFPGVEDSQPRWPEPTRLWRPLPRPWAKTTALGKGGDRVPLAKPSRPRPGRASPEEAERQGHCLVAHPGRHSSGLLPDLPATSSGRRGRAARTSKQSGRPAAWAAESPAPPTA